MTKPVVRSKPNTQAILALKILTMSEPLKALDESIGRHLLILIAKSLIAKLYKTKTPITAADMLNDRVLPFYEKHELPMLRILTDRGTEYCGRADQHDYQLYIALNDIEHTKTKVKSPQTNGICDTLSQDDSQ